MLTPKVLTIGQAGSFSLVTEEGPAVLALAQDPGAQSVATFVSVKTFGAVGDGVTDDSAAIQAGTNALAGTGQWLWFPTGTYLCKTGIAVPSNANWWGYGATLQAQLAGVSPSLASVLIFAAYTLSASSFPLHANVPQGSTQIQVTGSSIAAGSRFVLADGNCQAVYIARIVAPGAGFQTITLDRATLFPFTAATGVVDPITTFVQNVRIRGLTLQGPCFRYAQVGGSSIVFEDVQVNDSVGFASDNAIGCFVLAEGSFNCSLWRCSVTGPTGVALIACEACFGYDYTYVGHGAVSLAGWVMNLSAGCGAYGVDIFGAFDGVHCWGLFPCPSWPDGRQVGAYKCFVIGGSITGCTSAGVHTDQSFACAFENLAIVGNLVGVNFNDASDSPRLAACSVVDNQTTNVAVNSPTCDIENVDVSNVNFDGGTLVSGLHITNVNTNTETSRYSIRGLRASWAPTTQVIAVLVIDGGAGANATFDGVSIVGNVILEGSNPNVRIRDGFIHLPAAWNGGSAAVAALATGNGQVFLEHVELTAPAGSNSVQSSATHNTVWFGQGVTTGATAVPYALSGPTNRGQVTFNGSGAATISFPNATVESALALTLKTKSTAATSQPFITVTVTPGTGFTLASSAADDASTYFYSIE